MNAPLPIGHALRNARMAAGLSLREVSAETHGRTSPAALSLIERGHRYPSLRSLEALAIALRVVIRISSSGVSVDPQP